MQKSFKKWEALAILAATALVSGCDLLRDLMEDPWTDDYQDPNIPAIAWRESENEFAGDARISASVAYTPGVGFVFDPKGFAVSRGSLTALHYTGEEPAQAFDVLNVQPFDYLTVSAMPSARKNASGAKITSNAHSDDFPGVIFVWTSNFTQAGKQKDDGFLKVHELVFQKYVYFILTAKESSVYHDYLIMPQPGQKKTDDDCYIFHIQRQDKNINMVFLNGFRKRFNDDVTPRDYPRNHDGTYRYHHRGTNEALYGGNPPDDGEPAPDPANPGDSDPPNLIVPPEIENTLIGKRYVIISRPSANASIVDPDTVWKLPGMDTDIKTFWNTAIRNRFQEGWDALHRITVSDTHGTHSATWIWDRGDSWAYGITGWNEVLCAGRFEIDGTIVEDKIPFYFACDNAAAVYVNGKLAHYTTEAFEGRPMPGNTSDFVFTSFDDGAFGGDAWQYLYEFDLKPYLLKGFNEILIVAANADDNNGRWNEYNNPTGLIYGTEFFTTK